MMGLDQIIQQRAEEIISAVMAERKVDPGEFFTRKKMECATARTVAIRRLRKDGFSIGKIGEAMRMNEKSVLYHLSDERRAEENKKRARRYAANKLRVLCEARA